MTPLTPHRAHRRLVALLLIAVFTFPAVAEPLAVAAPERPRIGLVLSGGGARGAAHIGVLEVLEQLQVPIDVIVGTSMGALVGGAYASGMPLAEMRRRVAQIRTADIVRDELPRSEQSERNKRDERANFLGPVFGLRDGQLSLPKGAVAGVGLEALLRDFVQQRRETAFDRLPIPFRAIATDIETGQMHVLDAGSLASAMRASISIPGLFAPAEIDGRMLVDGGLTRNLPVDVARRMGVDIVIAVNLGTPLLRRDQVTSVIGVTTQMINILTEQNVRQSLASLHAEDILISPELKNFSASDFDHMGDVVVIGEAAARAVAPRLKNLALPLPRYLAHRASQRRAVAAEPAAAIDEIRFAGLRRANPEVLRGMLRTRVGRALDPAVLDADLAQLYGRGDFAHVGYQLVDEQGRRILVIDAEESPAGEDSLRFGLALSNDFEGNAHFQALARHRRNWVNSLGAQWRTDLMIGRINRLTSEFHQPLESGQSLFVTPFVDLESKPLDIFDGGNRVARFSRQSGLVGVDAGAQVGRLGEVRAGVYRGRRSFKLDTGPSALFSADDAIDIGGATLGLRSDQLDSATFPRSGYSLSADILASSPTLGARDRYTRWNAEYLTAFSHGAHTLHLALQAGGAVGSARLPTYDLFTFGGLMQLSGFRTGQLLGQSLVFGRAVYARRLSASSLFRGLFGGISIEAGRVGEPLLPNSPSGLIPAASVFLATDTPIGPVYLGLGQARGGFRALYLFLGVP